MALHFLERSPADPARADAAIDDYLTRLASELPGPSSARAAAIEEVRDGLLEATAGHIARGSSPPIAAMQAVTEFGPPVTVARAFAPEIATTQARRVLAGLLVTGPLVGVWWLLVLTSLTWPPQARALWTAIPALPLIAVAVAAAVVILATTGSLIRWLPETTPERALGAATAIAVGCIVGDLTVLATLAIRITTSPWHAPVVLAAIAVTASLCRIALTAWAIARTRNTTQHLRRIGS